MGGGYRPAPDAGDSLSPIVKRFTSQQTQLKDLQRPTGTNLAALYEQVQQALANITTTVTDAINALSYTRAEIDNLIANPPSSVTVSGDLSALGHVNAAGNVVATGQVFSTQPVQSPGSFAFQVTHGYVTCWINDDGTFGFSPSNRDSKQDLVEMGAGSGILSVKPYWGHYKTDDADAPLKVFVIAEDVQAAGFGPDVAPVDAEGNPFTVNYSQLVVPLLAEVRALRADFDAYKVAHP